MTTEQLKEALKDWAKTQGLPFVQLQVHVSTEKDGVRIYKVHEERKEVK